MLQIGSDLRGILPDFTGFLQPRDRYMFLVIAVVVVVLVHIGVVVFAHCRWWKASKSMHATVKEAHLLKRLWNYYICSERSEAGRKPARLAEEHTQSSGVSAYAPIDPVKQKRQEQTNTMLAGWFQRLISQATMFSPHNKPASDRLISSKTNQRTDRKVAAATSVQYILAIAQ